MSSGNDSSVVTCPPRGEQRASTPTSGSVLEEGVGRVNQIFVLTEVDGQLALASRSISSYFEFSWPMSDRLTDEAWRELLNSGQAPPRPEWTSSFIVE